MILEAWIDPQSASARWINFFFLEYNLDMIHNSTSISGIQILKLFLWQAGKKTRGSALNFLATTVLLYHYYGDAP
jgi:hypothetical protein